MEEEWAEGAGGFFDEFAASTKTNEKSARKRNREAHDEREGVRAARTARSEAERKMSAEEARRKIAAAVVSRASPKELSQARRERMKERGGAGPAKGPSGKAAETTTPPAATFHTKKRDKIEQKFARKKERKEEARTHAIKYRRSLRK